MKRYKNLYSDICNLNNIIDVTNNVLTNTKNKRRVNKFNEYKCVNISNIYKTLCNKCYVPGRYNTFKIYEPKERVIVSQSITDKIINQLISRYILMPALTPCLIDANVASRKGMGTSKGLFLFNNFYRKCKVKYSKFYILKCDISKFFSNINHDRLKEKILKRIKDKDALKIVFSIIDSDPNGLSIGNMTSQILAVFYLNDLDHYIKEELKIKYYVRYQDDFILFHESREYLKSCLEKIKKFLSNEGMLLNKKTRLYSNKDRFIYLGRNIDGKYARYREISKKIKKKQYLYLNNKVSLSSMVSTIMCYRSIVKIKR